MKSRKAKVLERAMTAENRDYLVNSAKLDSVVKYSIGSKGERNVGVWRVGTGLLGHLFKHGEDTCHAVIKKGALDAILMRCGAVDKDILRHCAIAFANMAMYGGEESQQIMVKKNVPDWLFHLAFSTDDVTRYYACLAICSLVANKEFEAAVGKSGTLSLVEPFIESHDPAEFADADESQIHGQSEGWLKKLLPVLESTNAEAQSLSAFHFCMESNIKDASDDVLKRIGAVEALMRVASCPNDTASKLAAKALRTLGEEVPHRLPQQVQLWRASDVHYWVKNVIDFPDYAKAFLDCKVDGDLLLQMSDGQLREDVGMGTGLHRQRFLRHLDKLKTTSDYSSCDHSKIDDWLMRIGAHMTRYTYNFNRVGVTKTELPWLTDDQLKEDIGIKNGIHRKMILQAVEEDKNQEMAMFGGGSGGSGEGSGLDAEGGESSTGTLTTTTTSLAPKFNKTVDVFISYRRSNGSQLASLLKVHLQLRNFVVFIDIEKLEAGKFDENLLNSVRAAKHFLLVLTPNALDRCVGDDDQNDWVHKEITTALNSGCNIIPITDDFTWPQPEILPEDMRKVCSYNGVKWIHDYQDACIAKVIRFIKGEPVAPSTVMSRGQGAAAGGLIGAAGSKSAPASSFASGSEYQSGLRETRNKWNSFDNELNEENQMQNGSVEDTDLDL